MKYYQSVRPEIAQLLWRLDTQQCLVKKFNGKRWSSSILEPFELNGTNYKELTAEEAKEKYPEAFLK